MLKSILLFIFYYFSKKWFLPHPVRMIILFMFNLIIHSPLKYERKKEEQEISEMATKKFSIFFFRVREDSIFLMHRMWKICTMKECIAESSSVYLWTSQRELDQRRLVIALERANKLYSTSRFMNHARLLDSTRRRLPRIDFVPRESAVSASFIQREYWINWFTWSVATYT